MAKRQCGSRVEGGAYMEVPLGPYGRPVEDFIVDPPIKISLDALGISSIGVQLITDPNTEITHVYDLVGEDSYPNVADFVEEVRKLGVSRRISRTVEFEKLTPQSRLILLHRRAWIENHVDYWNSWSEDRVPPRDCPTGKHDEIDKHVMCARYWWEDLDPATDPGLTALGGVRTLVSGRYAGLSRPEGIVPQYQPAIFMAFPLVKLVVINDPTNNTHEVTLAKVSKSSIGTYLEDE